MERDNSRLGRDTETSSAGQKLRDIVLIVRCGNEFSMTEKINSAGQKKQIQHDKGKDADLNTRCGNEFSMTKETSSVGQRKGFSIVGQRR